jgi:hypothetical protein
MEGARKRGKPGKRWTDYVQEDLKVIGIRNRHAVVRDRRKEGGGFRWNEGPQWDVVLEKRKNCNFVHEGYRVTTNWTKFFNTEPRFLRRSLSVIGLSKLGPTNKKQKS